MKPRILIVDDNPTNLKLAAALLEFEGYAIEEAGDAESALNLIRARPPQLVLLDVQLPVMDGLTLERIIKTDETLRHIRVVALTAFAMKSDEQRAFDAGCDGHIAKPIDVGKFPELVAKYLNGASQASLRP